MNASEDGRPTGDPNRAETLGGARDVWRPETYRAFSRHRSRAAEDLIARIPLSDPQRIVDLGCGAGAATRLLAHRWPKARIVGVDSSPAMLEQARAAGGDVDWRFAAIEDFTPDEAVDLVFSNAALHWLDDHATVLLRLLGWLRPGGALAIQMPRNFEEPSHAAIGETIEAHGWGARLRSLLRLRPVADPAVYADLLLPVCRDLDIWETVYLQMFQGDDPVVAWTSGAALPPLLAALDDDEQRLFLEDYRARLARAYPVRPDGVTLFPFRRLFLVGTR